MLLILMSSVSQDYSRQVWFEGVEPSENKFVVSKHSLVNHPELGHVVHMNDRLFKPESMRCYKGSKPCGCEDEGLSMVKVEFKRTPYRVEDEFFVSVEVMEV